MAGLGLPGSSGWDGLEAMLENLSWKRTILRRKVNSLSPTALLPTEILTKILRLTCQLEGRLGGPPITPIFFGEIYKDWREIAWFIPLLWNMILLHLSKGIWLPSSAAQRLAPASKFVATLHQVDIGDEHASISCSVCAIMTRSASIAFYLFNVMASSKTTISNADVGICETTQGNNFDLQRTTQHVLFCSQAH